MKSSFTLLAAGLVAVHAQAPASLPQCGQTCINNMLAVAVSDFGCDANDLGSCACCNADFGFGIRDCSQQVCGDGSEDYSSVISYGSSYCSSAVTTCPSGTQATTVLATATDGASNTTSSASGSMSTPAMTSGPLAGAVAAVSSASGSPDAYIVNGETISAGGDEYDNDGTAYTALPSNGGVLVSNGDTQTTYVPGSGANASSSMMTMSSSGGAGGALGAQVSNVQGSPNEYVIDGSTISAGGSQYTNDNGTTYTALPSAGGVLVAADGTSTTANPGQQGGVITIDPINTVTVSSGGSAGSASSTSSTGSGGSGGSGANSGNSDSGDSSPSSESGNFAPIQTAAPGLIGAVALAVMAL